MERFACPTPDRQGRYRCIDDHVLCDGFIDCPSGEDEDRQSCMFYKTVTTKYILLKLYYKTLAIRINGSTLYNRMSIKYYKNYTYIYTFKKKIFTSMYSMCPKISDPLAVTMVPMKNVLNPKKQFHF